MAFGRTVSEHDSLFFTHWKESLGSVQELLGHESVETTQIYPHVMVKPGLGVRSPLDRV